MNRALAATLVIISSTLVVNAASAQSYVEDNARDAVCEWSFKKQTGISKCHIIAMGTHGTGALVLMFTMNDKVYSLVEEDGHKTAQIGSGGFWDFKSQWSGSYREDYDTIGEGPASVNTIKLSNGFKIKLVY